jgi:predicted ATPase
MIKSLSLHNFKCFKERTFALGQLTLLTGLNSAGKSTVLQALLLLRQSYMQMSLPKRGLLLNGPLLNLGTSEGILNKAADEDRINISLSDNGQQASWNFDYHGPNEDLLSVLLEPPNYEAIPFFNSPFQYISAERMGPRAIYDHSFYNVQTKGHIGPDGRYAVAFLESRARQVVNLEMRHPAAKDETLFAQVTAWLGEISPGVQLEISVKEGAAAVQLRVGFTPALAEAIDYFDPRNVGFGVTYSLSVLVAVLSLPPGGFLVVENPEAHLHSRGQVAMGTLFALAAKSGIQVLVESHSDHFFNGLRLAVKNKILPTDALSINFFRRDSSKVATYEVDAPRIDENGRIDQWPVDFFDQWDKSLDQLLD